MLAVKVGEARKLIGETVVSAVRAGFTCEHEEMRYAERPAPPPAFQAGREKAGHDSSRVPALAAAEVESSITDSEPGMWFSYKVEYGHPPHIQLSVRSSWARQVAATGWAVLDGRAVLDVLEWDESVSPRRPARVRVALISADYDAEMHGWRAHADNRDLPVAWSPEGEPRLVMPWEEDQAGGSEAA
ncbi:MULTISPECIES: hypothetical protein [unclassified Kitasatospora]|uniref:hypothetical protein n=1 Tax=unclassified Kitasatospora TaxID=2633591 RepID=UPI000710A79A|nr:MULTISPECIES: hypothetical protein [unclassified Kitasatospora]KRB66413.1 hypothetical protein ASE03_30800 [Kitasatospora sp. Root187]